MKDKLLISVVLLCVFGSAVCMVLFARPNTSFPDLEVLPHPIQHIGGVRQFTETAVDFTLTNHSSVQLCILGVDVSCSCTVAGLSKKILEPGDSCDLRLLFKSTTERGTVEIRGRVAYRETGVEVTRFLLVGFVANVDAEYVARPDRIVFENDSVLIQRVSVYSPCGSQLHISEANCNSRFFRARILPQAKANVQDIEVVFSPDEWYPEAATPELIISMDSNSVPTMYIPIDVDLDRPVFDGS